MPHKKVVREGVAGTDKKMDLIVTISPGKNGVEVEVEGKDVEFFGEDIKRVVLETLKGMGVENAKVKVLEKTPLDFTIRARVRAAALRAMGVEE
ncbi:MAG: citrate lyase acyl carrier protein [Thermoplasmata archaeon]|nr:citrate lyase acyl carrier protein [Thermoplasmata archaeon]